MIRRAFGGLPRPDDDSGLQPLPPWTGSPAQEAALAELRVAVAAILRSSGELALMQEARVRTQERGAVCPVGPPFLPGVPTT